MESGQIANKTRIQRTEAEIFSLMEEYESSEGITVKEFCEMQDISTQTFYNWQKQYRNRNNESRQPGFMTVSVNAPEGRPLPTPFAEVGDIKIYTQVPASYLKELMS